FNANTGQHLEDINAGIGNNVAYFVVTGDISAANPDGDAIAWLNGNTRYLGQNTGINLFVSKRSKSL
ncbi:MAG: glycosyl transferase, partial [Methanomicrobiales archaeon]